MTNATHYSAKASAMTDEERLAWMRSAMDTHNLSWNDLARYTGYSYSTVGSWFTQVESSRHRPIPARAIDRLQLEIKAGNVRGSK